MSGGGCRCGRRRERLRVCRHLAVLILAVNNRTLRCVLRGYAGYSCVGLLLLLLAIYRSGQRGRCILLRVVRAWLDLCLDLNMWVVLHSCRWILLKGSGLVLTGWLPVRLTVHLWCRRICLWIDLYLALSSTGVLSVRCGRGEWHEGS